MRGDQLCLSVEDDGRGFAEEELEASIGTQLIRTFGQQLHGKAAIHSQKDKGTTAEIVFPDPQKKRRAMCRRRSLESFRRHARRNTPAVRLIANSARNTKKMIFAKAAEAMADPYSRQIPARRQSGATIKNVKAHPSMGVS